MNYGKLANARSPHSINQKVSSSKLSLKTSDFSTSDVAHSPLLYSCTDSKTSIVISQLNIITMLQTQLTVLRKMQSVMIAEHGTALLRGAARNEMKNSRLKIIENRRQRNNSQKTAFSVCARNETFTIPYSIHVRAEVGLNFQLLRGCECYLISFSLSLSTCRKIFYQTLSFSPTIHFMSDKH